MQSKSKAKNVKKSPRFIEEERMEEIYLLLNNLFEREEVTIKYVLDCLYDIGSVNLINQRIRMRFFSNPVQSVARVSKPMFKMLAIRWFKRNCPELITEWLYSKILFEPAQPKKKPPRPVVDVPTDAVARLESRTQEVQQLRSQVKLLTGSLVLITAVLGGTVVWLGYNLQLSAEVPESLNWTTVEDKNRE
jgi:hypothetical protein